MLTQDKPRSLPYPYSHFVTVTAEGSGRSITSPFPDEGTALLYALNMRDDGLFSVRSASFDWHVTFYVTSKDAEMSAKFNEIAGAEEFITMADRHPDLVVIEYNFVSSA